MHLLSTYYHLYRHFDAKSRPKFVDVIKVLNQPDFKLLKWSPEDLEAYSEEMRTVGSGLENGMALYTKLQQTYKGVTLVPFL